MDNYVVQIAAKGVERRERDALGGGRRGQGARGGGRTTFQPITCGLNSSLSVCSPKRGQTDQKHVQKRNKIQRINRNQNNKNKNDTNSNTKVKATTKKHEYEIDNAYHIKIKIELKIETLVILQISISIFTLTLHKMNPLYFQSSLSLKTRVRF